MRNRWSCLRSIRRVIMLDFSFSCFDCIW
jgi:hypothetical protein